MNNKKNPALLNLFLSFLRLGITAFGGPAMVVYIRELSVNKQKWLDEESFSHGVALCQTIPGAIAVNMASYVGFRIRGLAGMITSFAAFVLPAFFLLLAFSAVYTKTHNLPAMISLFSGLQVVVIAIIINATASFGKTTLKKGNDILIAAASATALLLKVSPFPVIIGAALAGIFLYDIRGTEKQHALSSEINSLKTFHRDFKNSFLLLALFLASFLILYFFDRKLFDLAFVMSKIELFAFGGGYTALTLMFHETVEAKAWLDSKTFMDGVALGQITPGPILITATFIGYLFKNLSGAVVGTLAIFTPGLILITAVLPIFDKLRSSYVFLRAIKGIISCFAGLLLFVTIKFAIGVSWDTLRVVLCTASLAAIYRKVDILYVIIGGAIISVLIF